MQYKTHTCRVCVSSTTPHMAIHRNCMEKGDDALCFRKTKTHNGIINTIKYSGYERAKEATIQKLTIKYVYLNAGTIKWEVFLVPRDTLAIDLSSFRYSPYRYIIRRTSAGTWCWRCRRRWHKNILSTYISCECLYIYCETINIFNYLYYFLAFFCLLLKERDFPTVCVRMLAYK